MSTTRAGFNTKSPTIKRILSESRELASHPDPTLHATPLETNLFEWHFTIAGPPSSPYENGIYHGRIILPPTYPLRPPMFRFSTPSGRFEVNREICLSISGHHEETWQPAWGIRTALCAIRAFMETGAAGQLGGLETGEPLRRELAGESKSWKCTVCERSNADILDDERERWESMKSKGLIKEGKTEVPEELRLAYKDDIGKQAEGTAAAPSDSSTPSPHSGSASDAGTIGKAAAAAEVSRNATPRNGQTEQTTTSSSGNSILVPAQMRRAGSTNLATIPTRTTTPRQTVSVESGVPAWVDRAIIGVVLSMIVMILRRFLA